MEKYALYSFVWLRSLSFAFIAISYVFFFSFTFLTSFVVFIRIATCIIVVRWTYVGNNLTFARIFVLYSLRSLRSLHFAYSRVCCRELWRSEIAWKGQMAFRYIEAYVLPGANC